MNLPQEIIDFINSDFKPNHQIPIIRSIWVKLGKYDKYGYYNKASLIVYLRISNSTFNYLLNRHFGMILDRIHYTKCIEILVFIESRLTMQERIVEEEKFKMGL